MQRVRLPPPAQRVVTRQQAALQHEVFRSVAAADLLPPREVPDVVEQEAAVAAGQRRVVDVAPRLWRARVLRVRVETTRPEGVRPRLLRSLLRCHEVVVPRQPNLLDRRVGVDVVPDTWGTVPLDRPASDGDPGTQSVGG